MIRKGTFLAVGAWRLLTQGVSGGCGNCSLRGHYCVSGGSVSVFRWESSVLIVFVCSGQFGVFFQMLTVQRCC